jgi:hypothetical protein
MGYPWTSGDALLATDLNAAIAGAGINGGINVIDYGADPTGVADSADAINAAAAEAGTGGRHRAVYLPTGVYRVNKQINLTATQAMFGDSRGSSVIQVDDRFDPAASAVIMCTSSYYDPGPVIRDLGIYFVQPSDQASRANFKTLAAGGTSAPGGTGVKYPWAISTGGPGPTRLQIMRVRIGGAWDGISSPTNVLWLEDIEMGALECGVSIGESATGVQDFSHISGYHFWNFDLGGSLFGVFTDGQTIAMRVGRVDGLNVRDFSSYGGRLVVTSQAAGFCSIHITNCFMDTDPATIEVNGDMLQFNISNMSGSAGTGRFRPLVSIAAACNMHVTNLYSHSSSPFSDWLLTHDSANVTINGFRSLFYPTTLPWAEVRQGLLRITNGLLFVAARTVAAIAETSNGRLVVDNITVSASGGPTTGPLLSMVTANTLSRVGSIAMDPAAAWTVTLPGGLSDTRYSPITSFANGAVFANLFQAPTLALAGATGTVKALAVYSGASLGWALGTQGASDDFALQRFNTSGVFQSQPISIARASGAITFIGNMGFNSATPIGKPTITGAKGGNVALAALLTSLANYGLITDSTT